MFVRRPIIMKRPLTVPEQDGLKKSIDAFLDLLITSGKESFEADGDFGFSLEDYHFEIFDPNIGLFTPKVKRGKKDLISSIEDPMYQHKISGSSINTDTFARNLRDTIVQYEQRLKNVEVFMDFAARGALLVVSVKGVIDDDYDTPYTYISKIRIW